MPNRLSRRCIPLMPLAGPGLVFFALVACTADPSAAPGSPPAVLSESVPGGHYAMAAPLTSELRVVALPGRPGVYRVEVHGGGDPADGAGIAADCQAVAEGALQAGVMTAPLQAFDSPIGGLEAADLADAPTLRLHVKGDTATLEGTFAHCPIGTAMAGTYHRTVTPKSLIDCPPLPAACWNRD